MVKMTDDGQNVMLSGYLVRFGSPDDVDLQGEYFTKDTKFTYIPTNGQNIPLVFADDLLDKNPPIYGHSISFEQDDKGLYFQFQMDRHKAEWGKLEKTIRQMYFASGSRNPTSVEYSVDTDGWIREWDIDTAVLTTTPTNPPKDTDIDVEE